MLNILALMNDLVLDSWIEYLYILNSEPFSPSVFFLGKLYG
jgi:hypothetical protein